MVHWSPFVMSFKKKYPWIQLAGHAGSEALPGSPWGHSAPWGAAQHVGRGEGGWGMGGPGGGAPALDAPGGESVQNKFSEN